LNAQPLGIKPGTASACVTTKTFLEAFGFASLRYLPDLERLKAEKLLRGGQGKDDLDNALGLSTEHVMFADGEWTHARAEAAARLELLNQSRFVGHCSGL
jgi:hypothetical protein